MAKTIYEKMERIGAQILSQNGAIISIVNDGVSEGTQVMLHAHNHTEVHNMFLMLFGKEPSLMSTALHAISMVMDMKDYGDEDSDDEDDEDNGIGLGDMRMN